MKTEKENKIIILLSLFILCALSVYAQNSCIDEEKFISFNVKICLPCNYKKNIFNYEEGKFIDYIYPDSSMITVFAGAMQKLPLLSQDLGYYSQSVDTLNDRIINRGIKDNKYWREDAIDKGLRVVYMNVSCDKLLTYDRIIDSLCIILRNKEE
jgi:hypothetical protein